MFNRFLRYLKQNTECRHDPSYNEAIINDLIPLDLSARLSLRGKDRITWINDKAYDKQDITRLEKELER